MRFLHLAGPVFAFVTAFAAYGCTLDVSGVSPDATSTSGMPSTSSVGGAGPSSSSASSGQGGGGGGGAGTTATTSTATSVASSSSSGCVPTVEICDNGIDDDCDGLVDCADPGCSGPPGGSACVPEAPAGWALTSVAPDTGGGCPAGFGTPVPLAAPPGVGGATCDCTCGAPSSNPCTKGSLTITSGSNCTEETITSTVTGGCDTLGATLMGPHKSFIGTIFPPASVACAVTLGKPAPVPSTTELTCAPTPSSAGGCAGGLACLPKLASGQVCVQAKGDIGCPMGSPFTIRHVVGTPGDVTDGRTCAACTCTSNASVCSNATFTAYTDVACSANPVSASVTGVCGVAKNNASFQNDTHFTYTATPNVTSCAASSATTALSGGFQVNSPTTICCQP